MGTPRGAPLKFMNLNWENKKFAEGYKYVIGCDEVGRGCLAGPVVACALVLPQQVESKKLKVIKSLGVKDSKLMTAIQREKIAPLLKEICSWSIGIVSEKEIDQINIHNASLLAMRKAVEGLEIKGVIPKPSASEGEVSKETFGSIQDDTNGVYLYIDGKFSIPNFAVSQESVIGGDNKVLSIAAASIIAKVYRDKLMVELHKKYPLYNLNQHKGYATLEHRRLIKKFGLSPLHRLSFNY